MQSTWLLNAALAALILGEELTIKGVGGALLVSAGLWLMTTR